MTIHHSGSALENSRFGGSITNRLLIKLSVIFLMLIVLVGIAYMLITVYFSNKYYNETTQQLNAEVASHLINEKFQNASPFLEDGSVNKPLFGDIMHDMMAVNRGIEVYLLDKEGVVLYSVVLSHDGPDDPLAKVDLAPVRSFIQNDGKSYVLGDNPRKPEEKTIFSAAHFTDQGQEGYIYIVLASKEFENVTKSLLASYYIRLGLGASLLTVLFAGGIGLLAIWYLTKNLREIIFAVQRFKEGDLTSRIPNAAQTDLSVLATTYNEMADTIVRNIEQLQSVDKLRKELIANVSHDLRTPLAIMQGYIETLQIKGEQLHKQEKEKYLQIIRGSAEKLARLVSQLFEYSKLEAKQIEPQKEPFQITELALDNYYKYQVLAKNKGVRLELDVKDKTPLVFADIGLVDRVIQNLMDNALKFTPEGGTVTLQIKPTKSTIEIIVKDTGPGIPEVEQSYIFERYRKSSPTKEINSGAGLGLAIVKKILEIHDSTIKVISAPEQGTAFTFWLPVYEEDVSLT
ncbi:HAMP domain-containing sensor histidine kinase [Rapidithrix thailandica]|uniref:histidine kinase n=1 Tax=Rapidithrix thailandica TaxID=413964 RepID=A0AAW9SDW6_9BACT